MKTKTDFTDDRSRQKFQTLLSQSGISDYNFTTDKFSAYDAEFIGNNGKKYLVELKERSDNYVKYNDLLLEKKKYDKLMEIKEKKGYDYVLYAHTYPTSDEIRVANLTKLNINWQEESLQKTNFNKRVKTSKDIAYITDYKTFNIG